MTEDVLGRALAERLRAERDERRRLAELIHDGPVQLVAAIAQMLDAAGHALAAGDVSSGAPIVERALAMFEAYRVAVAPYRGDPHPGDLPRDPTYLSWTLAAVAPLAMPDRQALLELDDTALRLTMVADMLRSELQAMNAIPSLPATEVARTRWSPN